MSDSACDLLIYELSNWNDHALIIQIEPDATVVDVYPKEVLEIWVPLSKASTLEILEQGNLRQISFRSDEYTITKRVE